MKEKIYIGCDDAAIDYKKAFKELLVKLGYEPVDVGVNDTDDHTYYPYIAERLSQEIQQDPDHRRGILICGTGIGISITANKVKGIRAALCSDCFSAEATRQHNDANILAMGARVLGEGLALKIVDTFLDTPFSNDPRHIRRIGKIED